MKKRTPRTRVAAIAVAVAAAVGLALPTQALASVPQATLVIANAEDFTPNLVSTTAVPHPHVDAVALLGGQTFAGGDFESLAHAGTTFARTDLAAFDATTGSVSQTFNPVLAGGQVWSIATNAATSSVYVGGEFTSVNGVTRAPLVKLDATSGAVDNAFTPPFKKAHVTDVQLISINGVNHVIVASNAGKRLWSLNPTTGVDDGYIHSTITNASQTRGAPSRSTTSRSTRAGPISSPLATFRP
jgi:hypothetical protein